MFLLKYLPLLLSIGIPVVIYYWALYVNKYWKRKNVPYIPATPIIGNLKQVLMYKKCVADHFSDIYFDKKTSETPIVGIHMFHKPTLMIKEPDLIRKVLVKDFGSFANRHSASDCHTDALGGYNLFFIRNQAWKQMRARLTPTFTSGKIKHMFSLLNQIGLELNKEMLSMKINDKTKMICTEMKDLCARYTTDVIASCIFGVQANSLKNPDCEFRINGRKVFDFNWYRALEFTSFFFLPEIVSTFRFKIFSKETTLFLRESINHVMDEREQSGATRNDLIDTLMSLKREDKNKTVKESEIVFQGDMLIAQAAVFFTAGFETSSSLMSFGLYELSWQPELQKKLRIEIKDSLAKNNGELTYDIVQSMEYLNMVVSEILRMYPPLPFLDRLCTLPKQEKGYSLEPYDDFLIPNGMPIIIPIFAIQRDPKYFPNPEKFDPERFSPENKGNIKPYTYLPFGTGPHNCIGDRFGLMQAKVGMINFFKNHYVTPSEKTPRTMKLEKKALIIQSEGGIYLNIVRKPLS